MRRFNPLTMRKNVAMGFVYFFLWVRGLKWDDLDDETRLELWRTAHELR